MVRIRLRRGGLKKQPSYRIVVIDQKKQRDGKYLEAIGYYNPRTRPTTITLHEDRALYWLSVGAQPSDAVAKLFNITGTMDRLARLKQGEAMDVLVQEAEEAKAKAEPISPRTRFPAPVKSQKKGGDAIDAAEAAVETEATKTEE